MPTVYRFPCGCQWPVVGPAPREGALPLLDVDDENLPFCPATWELLGRGDTKGVFQLESNLGRQWTKKLRPESGEHMGALGALLRPGCMRAVDDEGVSMTQHYCRRKNNEEDVKPYHPAIDWILKPTYGTLCFQEQSMEIVKAVAGFNLQEADQLRKAVGKKLPEEMAKVKKMFLEGTAKTGILNSEQAEEVFGWIEKSQRYAFNRSHAVSYGLTGYDTAYIKAHFPVAFYCSWLRFARDKQDPLQEIYELVNDAKLNDVEVRPPDLRNMEPHFATDGVQVTFGLSDIKGVGVNQVVKVRDIIERAEKELGKPLAQWTWNEFLFFVSHRLNTGTVERLARVGALSWMGVGRQRMQKEFTSWSELTDCEREWVLARERLARGLCQAADLAPALLPEPEGPVVEQLPPDLYGHLSAQDRQKLLNLEQTKRLKKATTRYRTAQKAWQKKADARQHFLESLANQKPFADVAAAIAACGRTRKEGGGATSKRVETLQGMAYLLEHPSSPLDDRPDQIAWDEEQFLGIALTCNRVDAFNQRDVNTSCKDFLAGKTGYMVFGVTIEQVREVKTRRGKNPGQKMAFLTISDGSCSLSDVICFPDVWKDYGGLLREENCVIFQGERDHKQGTLVVKKVCQMER